MSFGRRQCSRPSLFRLHPLYQSFAVVDLKVPAVLEESNKEVSDEDLRNVGVERNDLSKGSKNEMEELTVECESVQLTVAFCDVLQPPVFTPMVKQKRPAAPRIITPFEQAPTPLQVLTPVSSTALQFMAIVRPDGTEIGTIETSHQMQQILSWSLFTVHPTSG